MDELPCSKWTNFIVRLNILRLTIGNTTSSGDTLQIFLRVSKGVTGSILKPEDEASQLAVEESGLAELELDNPVLDKPVLDKLEAGFDHD
nr:hypothetical protein [Tanacetum cinerariifolium]